MSRRNELLPPIISRPVISNQSPFSGNGNGQLRWDHRPPPPQDVNTRIGAGVPAEHRPYDEPLAIRPLGLTRIPLESYFPSRIVILSSNRNHGMTPMLPQFPHQLTSQTTMHVPAESSDHESKLTKEEQEIVIKKLKKEIYNPMPKTLARRVSLYYRELNRDNPNAGATSIDKNKDEDGKQCAVCLEDFEPREEVMVTPCKHMFHEECIVPWVKNHGQCPVCRYTLFDRIMRESGSTLNNVNSRVTIPSNHHDLFTGELLSLIQAVDDAFPWGA